MAIFSYADFTASPSATPIQYKELINNVQRLTPILRFMPIEQGVTSGAINFDVKVSGKTAANVTLDGGALLSPDADQRYSITLPYGEIGASMRITDKFRRVAGSTMNHDFLMQQAFMKYMTETASALARLLNQQIYSGTGATSQMTGLSTAVAASGAYGGLTHANWVATVSENGGVLRNLTLPILRIHLTSHSTAVGNTFGRPDLAFCKGGIFDFLLGLFTTVQNVTPGVEVNPSVIYTVAGRQERTGFRAFSLPSEGLTFIEDQDVTHTGSTNPTNGIYFMNSAAVGLEQLAPAEQAMTSAATMAAAMESMGPIAGLLLEVMERGRTVHASEWDVTSMVGLKVKCRAATSWLGDLNVAS